MTAIEWTQRPRTKGETWNPIRARYFEPTDDGAGRERIGWHCEHVSEGCRNCYADRMNDWRGTGLAFKPGNLYRESRKGYSNGEAHLFLDEKTLVQPLRWRDPRTVFVCSMTDIGAAFVTDGWLDRMFAAMALSPDHTFQVLSKRPERLREYLINPNVGYRQLCAAHKMGLAPPSWKRDLQNQSHANDHLPLPNVWLGTSVEDQATADARIPHLLATPAAVRFVSYEPALGPVQIDQWLTTECQECDDDGLGGRGPNCPTGWCPIDNGNNRLDWIIAGGESGRNARPPHPDWFRSARDQCAAAGVAFFFKQWGEWLPGPQVGRLLSDAQLSRIKATEIRKGADSGLACATFKVGKKTAGATLDGREHRAFPA